MKNFFFCAVNYAELVDIHEKVGQLLQCQAGILKKSGKYYHNVRQLHVITKWRKSYCKIGK